MNIRAELDELRRSIDELLVSFPELADDEQLRADTFEGETEITGLLAKLVDYSNEAAAMAGAIKARKAEIGERQARYERKEDAMRALVTGIMDRAGLAKVTLPEATLSIRHIPPAPFVPDIEALAGDCVLLITTKKADMVKIKEAIAMGSMPDGVIMSNGKNSLTIRTK